MSSLVLLVELQMKPGQLDAFLARAREHRINVLGKEPGCQGFEVLVPAEGGDTVFLYEVAILGARAAGAPVSET